MANFTIRLEDNHENLLRQIGEKLGTKGKNETITKMIEVFLPLQEELKNTKRLYNLTFESRKDLIGKIQNYLEALESLKSI